jgi:hypothetical protein
VKVIAWIYIFISLGYIVYLEVKLLAYVFIPVLTFVLSCLLKQIFNQKFIWFPIFSPMLVDMEMPYKLNHAVCGLLNFILVR